MISSAPSVLSERCPLDYLLFNVLSFVFVFCAGNATLISSNLSGSDSQKLLCHVYNLDHIKTHYFSIIPWENDDYIIRCGCIFKGFQHLKMHQKTFSSLDSLSVIFGHNPNLQRTKADLQL